MDLGFLQIPLELLIINGLPGGHGLCETSLVEVHAQGCRFLASTFAQQRLQVSNGLTAGSPGLERGDEAAVVADLCSQDAMKCLGEDGLFTNQLFVKESALNEGIIAQNALTETVDGKDAGAVESKQGLAEQPLRVCIQGPASVGLRTRSRDGHGIVRAQVRQAGDQLAQA